MAGKLGVPLEAINVLQGDTDDIAYGTGTGACRSIIVGGSAVSVTAHRIAQDAAPVAAVPRARGVSHTAILSERYD